MFGIVSAGIGFECVTKLAHVLLFAVNSLKEFGKLLSSVEDERDKIVSHCDLFWSCFVLHLAIFASCSFVRCLTEIAHYEIVA